MGRGCALPCVARPLHGDAFGAAWADAESDTASDTEDARDPVEPPAWPGPRAQAASRHTPPCRGWGGLLFPLHGSSRPCLRAGRPTLAECAAPPYTRCLTARCRRVRPFFSPMPPGEQHSNGPWPSARAYASRHSHQIDLARQVRRRRFDGESADSRLSATRRPRLPARAGSFNSGKNFSRRVAFFSGL